jgi:hypothetical protein
VHPEGSPSARAITAVYFKFALRETCPNHTLHNNLCLDAKIIFLFEAAKRFDNKIPPVRKAPRGMVILYRLLYLSLGILVVFC